MFQILSPLMFALFFSGISFASGLGTQRPTAHFWLGGSQKMQVEQRQPVMMELAIKAPMEMGGMPDDDMDKGMMEMSPWMKDFVSMHMKFMHMVIIKKDLSHIAHIHPSYDSGSGYFSIPFNLPTQHPDNFATIDVLPSAGDYAVFAEAKSKRYGFLTFRADLEVTNKDGEKPRWRIPLQLDHRSEEGHITKCLDYESQLVCQHRVTLVTDVDRGCRGNLIRFSLYVERLDKDGTYINDKELQPWMMMGAHALLARDSGKMGQEDYFHLHGEMPQDEAPSILQVSTFNRGQLTDSNYRMWVQFKSMGKIQTVPFTFRYRPQSINDDLCPGMNK